MRIIIMLLTRSEPVSYLIHPEDRVKVMDYMRTPNNKSMLHFMTTSGDFISIPTDKILLIRLGS